MLASSVESVSEQPELLASSLQEPEEMGWKKHPYLYPAPTCLILQGSWLCSLSHLLANHRPHIFAHSYSQPRNCWLVHSLFLLPTRHHKPQDYALVWAGWLMAGMTHSALPSGLLKGRAQATSEVLCASKAMKSAGCGVRTPGFEPSSIHYQLGQSLFLVKPVSSSAEWES